MYYTYVLLSEKDNHMYTGYSSDLRKRLSEHHQGQVFSTRGRRPLKLIYYEACVSENDARQRERYLKSGRGKNYLKVRLRCFLQCSGYGPNAGTP